MREEVCSGCSTEEQKVLMEFIEYQTIEGCRYGLWYCPRCDILRTLAY